MFTVEDANQNKTIFTAAIKNTQEMNGWMTSDDCCNCIIKACKDYLGLKIDKPEAVKIVSLASDGGRKYWNASLMHDSVIANRVAEIAERATGAELIMRTTYSEQC